VSEIIKSISNESSPNQNWRTTARSAMAAKETVRASNALAEMLTVV